MSTATKWLIALVVLVLILAGLFYWYHVHMSAGSASTSTAAPEEQTTLPSGSSTSDAALQEDLSSIDTQIQASNNDTASATESVNADVAPQ